MRQRCCVANSIEVTVLDAGPVVAIVKITSAHMRCPFVVVVGLASHTTEVEDQNGLLGP